MEVNVPGQYKEWRTLKRNSIVLNITEFTVVVSCKPPNEDHVELQNLGLMSLKSTTVVYKYLYYQYIVLEMHANNSYAFQVAMHRVCSVNCKNSMPQTSKQDLLQVVSEHTPYTRLHLYRRRMS